VVGAWSGADPESLEFATGLVVAESPWPEVAVRVRREPFALRCRACGREFEPAETDLRCPGCGGADVETLRGAEVRLESLEVE
jgi:Zn finger protein HypA/HybF involved in hydrogenase expression